MGMSEAVRPERAEMQVEKRGHTPLVIQGTAVETKEQVRDDGWKDGVLTLSSSFVASGLARSLTKNRLMTWLLAYGKPGAATSLLGDL